jgi:hypothetical protein
MKPVRAALRRGLIAFGLVAVAGQIVPTAVDLFGGGLAFPTALKIGWFYTLAFHRVGLDVDAAAHGYRLSIAFLSGTGLALWLLYRAGRAAADLAGPASRERLLVGAMVAPAYALPIGLITLVTRLQLAPAGELLPDAVRVNGVAWQAFLFPLVMAAVAGGAGGLTSALPEAARGRAWLVGGWRMLLMALGLAFVGVLLLAAVRPAGLRTYARGVSANGPRVAFLIVGHHALLAPNQSFFVLAPSMGGCISLGGSSASVPLMCPGRLPAFGSEVPAAIDAVRSGGPAPSHRPMPIDYWAFLLVPAIATIAGGRWAAGGVGGRERLIRGAGAGVVFGVLVGLGAWASSVAFQGVTLGPAPAPTMALGISWGVVGGALGAVLPVPQAVVGAPGPPPSPTSV